MPDGGVFSSSGSTSISSFRTFLRDQRHWHGTSGLISFVRSLGDMCHVALQDAQANGYVVVFEDDAETKMGILHAAYGKSVSEWTRQSPISHF